MKENSEYIHLRNTSTSLHTSRFTRTQKICCHIYTQMKNDLHRFQRIELEDWPQKVNLGFQKILLFFSFNSAKRRLWDDNFWPCSVVQLRGVGCGDRRMGHQRVCRPSVWIRTLSLLAGLRARGPLESGHSRARLCSQESALFECSHVSWVLLYWAITEIKHWKIKYNFPIIFWFILYKLYGV